MFGFDFRPCHDNKNTQRKFYFRFRNTQSKIHFKKREKKTKKRAYQALSNFFFNCSYNSFSACIVRPSFMGKPKKLPSGVAITCQVYASCVSSEYSSRNFLGIPMRPTSSSFREYPVSSTLNILISRPPKPKKIFNVSNQPPNL